ncbi:hypothetical protein EDL99_11110 [Ornithobacterium rhinotracheale]|uniref:hypothetical protein n=1 Tax=Ornithobacterium rhinotracheale TaxID=28251 RepID=UPI00129C6AEF|nr:hypothetical protein [Ornithobacterium rhinotracheale]MRJ09400.1 hypothetical protein [Ornithobacterium rhinotracheale]UOH78745.1 hypothetical protein MT996_04550 [Ornithobacterium rhinotracheale]
MEKINLKITPEQLNAILTGLEEVPHPLSKTPEQRAVRSIFDELLTKLLKKQVEKRNEPQNNPFKMTLKYHEAYALSVILTQVRELLPPYYMLEKTSILRINFQISEQL